MMLPEPGTCCFPWEVSAGRAPDGDTLRTLGRLYSYDTTRSRVTLVARHRSHQHPILVWTKLVEPLQAQVGSLYTVLGELGHQKAGGRVVKARVLACVGGTSLPWLEQAVREERLYQRKGASSQ
ncbi:CST complex subunit TEN1-like [Balaenoptera ricei]|uniref:CST complex subunit TEN1-like n=1 Tax=Balaenoptera ricei TaxID=2746895 RepID=UPI0028BE00A4|nr:CST complex subunit TEN1-like [Balaenoptera ricei]